jgi:glycosyltransferase involved in cell wall biosynthesis
MSERPRASIIISSYNYARFLRDAIDSALTQSTANAGAVEVIVVDDGSTDESPQIIRSYGRRVCPVLKANRGQASAINAGFACSTAAIVFLLDSDDFLMPGAVERALPAFDDPRVVKAHWSMRVVDEHGAATGRSHPDRELSDGDLRDAVLRDGPEAYEWPPTGGNAWRRSFLETALPIPEEAYRTCPDLYLAALVPVAGIMRRIDEPLSCWRLHGQNNTWEAPFEQRLPRFIQRWDLACDALVEHCRENGLPHERERWRARAWCHRVERAVETLCRIVPFGRSVTLIDANDWGAAGGSFDGRRCLPFVEHDGQYWGLPADDNAAIEELERQRAAGSDFAALAWPCFWWCEHYPRFARHLAGTYPVVFADDDVRVFQLSNVSR